MYSHINVQKHIYNHMYIRVKNVYVYENPDVKMGAESFLFSIHSFICEISNCNSLYCWEKEWHSCYDYVHDLIKAQEEMFFLTGSMKATFI